MTGAKKFGSDGAQSNVVKNEEMRKYVLYIYGKRTIPHRNFENRSLLNFLLTVWKIV